MIEQESLEDSSCIRNENAFYLAFFIGSCTVHTGNSTEHQRLIWEFCATLVAANKLSKIPYILGEEAFKCLNFLLHKQRTF